MKKKESKTEVIELNEPGPQELEKLAERQAKLDMAFADYPDTMRFLCGDGAAMSADDAATLLTMAQSYGRGRGISDLMIDSTMEALLSLGKAFAAGRYSTEMVETVMKGLLYDHDLAKAAGDAELRGRNARIEEKMRDTRDSDGVPYLGSSGSRRRSRGIFSLAESAR